MPSGEPVSLVAAIVVAVLGGALGVFLVARLFVEVRQRRSLRSELPNIDAYDPDVRRYLTRVWLLIGAWRPRLSADGAARLDELWGEAFSLAQVLQEKRSNDEEVASDVAEMVSLENRIEVEIDELRQPAQ